MLSSKKKLASKLTIRIVISDANPIAQISSVCDYIKWTIRSTTDTAQKMKLPIKAFFSKCKEIGNILRIWSHFLKKSLMEKFIFCAVIFFYVIQCDL